LMDRFDLYHGYTMAFELNCLVAAGGIVAAFFARMPMPPTVRDDVPPAEMLIPTRA